MADGPPAAEERRWHCEVLRAREVPELPVTAVGPCRSMITVRLGYVKFHRCLLMRSKSLGVAAVFITNAWCLKVGSAAASAAAADCMQVGGADEQQSSVLF